MLPVAPEPRDPVIYRNQWAIFHMFNDQRWIGGNWWETKEECGYSGNIYIIIINYTYIIAICGIIVGIVPTKLVLDLWHCFEHGVCQQIWPFESGKGWSIENWGTLYSNKPMSVKRNVSSDQGQATVRFHRIDVADVAMYISILQISVWLAMHFSLGNASNHFRSEVNIICNTLSVSQWWDSSK